MVEVAVKRRRRKKRQTLDAMQELDLVFNRYKIFDPHRSPWATPLERRSAWFAHRHEILNDEWIAEYPGMRPGAWWAYECPKLERLPEEEDWEFLIRAGEVKEAEKNKILAGWVRKLHLRKGYLRMIYRHHLEGIPSYPEWPPEELENWHRQAELLGPAAVRELKGILAEITGQKEEEK